MSRWILCAAIVVLVAISAVQGQCVLDQQAKLNATESAVIYVQSAHDFSVGLLKMLYNAPDITDRNVFFSPHSIWSALTLAYLGSAGRTQTQMERTMGLHNLTKADVLRAFKYVQFWYQMRNVGDEDLPTTVADKHLKKNQFNVATRAYFDRAETVRDCMQDVLSDEIQTADFTYGSDEARRSINDWVASRTADRIRELIPPGVVDSSTRMVLANAAYFKGTWQSKFKPSNTKLELFYTSRDDITFVNMMTQKGQFNYGLSEELQAHVLELPYNGEEISMFVVLPPFTEGALDVTVEQLTPALLKRTLTFMWKVDMTVKIPKFRIEESYEISRTLVDLGMEDLFDGARSNLTGFSESGNLFLSNALHKSFLQMDEEGSEAAAATALISSRTSRPVQVTQFTCNHPFLYLIYDRALENILFMGTFEHPKSAKLDLDKEV